MIRQSHTPTVLTNPSLPDNPIILVNEAFLSLTGYERDEVMGRNCRFLAGEETDVEVSGKIRLAVQESRPITATLLNHRKDGSRFWSELHISPILDETGTLVFFVGYQRDITWKVEADEALRDAHAEIGKRLAEREDLIREIQHRVRNNLQTIISLLHLERRRGDPAVRERVGVIARRVGVLGSIHEQLEAFGNWNTIDFGRHLRETSAAFANLFEDTVAIEVDADPFICDVQTAVSLGLITNELISAQLDLVSRGDASRRGEIRVVFRHREDAGVVELTVKIVGAGTIPRLVSDALQPSDIVDALVEGIGAELVLDGGETPTMMLVVPARNLMTER
ncbi:hypothetical protein N825_16085 [Skermanella stibiiresistens SB22]|uniref:Histidine kinase n=1 Tax=Skermanella stibiiresistens SB22 TaxID=1385369 RepID=W9GZ84_9PROT|nr:hypothetical protein N825_16085 [Skermanella stibiiresistens SB22]